MARPAGHSRRQPLSGMRRCCKSVKIHTRTALDRFVSPRCESISATSRATGSRRSSAARFNASQKAASSEIEVACPAIVNDRLMGRALPEARFGGAAAWSKLLSAGWLMTLPRRPRRPPQAAPDRARGECVRAPDLSALSQPCCGRSAHGSRHSACPFRHAHAPYARAAN